MDRFLLSLRKRVLVPAIATAGIFLWLFLCHMHYESYWNGTIARVQTTDFNMLHHTLPATLSCMILEGRDDLIQKTLDSSYGLFGLVVTDPDGENILYRTDKVYHQKSWQAHATPEELNKSGEPYDLITDPPQLEPMYSHASPREPKALATGAKVRGRVLGRLYYMRSPPPTFFGDIGNFLFTGMAEISGGKRGYCYISFACLFFSTMVLLLIYLRKRGVELKQKEVEHVRRELDIRKKALEHLSNELATQKARKVWLEREADQAYRRAIALKEHLERLRDALAGSMAQAAEASHGKAPQGVASVGQQATSYPRIRPPVSPPSSILEEIEVLIPDLSENARVLRSQAEVLHDYCNTLEERQVEMKRIVENAFTRAQSLKAMAAGPTQGFAPAVVSAGDSAAGGTAGPGVSGPAVYGMAQSPAPSSQATSAAGAPKATYGGANQGDMGEIIDMSPG